MPLPSAQTRRFIKRARGAGATGQASVLRVSREHYLRSDLPLPPEPALRPFLLVPDTNVVLRAASLFELDAVQEVVILQTVLQETRKQSPETYDRIRRLLASPEAKRRHLYLFSNEHCAATFSEPRKGESPNDYYDRLIRKSVAWLNTQYNALQGPRVVLLTEDRENARRARDDDHLVTFSLAQVDAWCAGAADTRVRDLVADSGGHHDAALNESASEKAHAAPASRTESAPYPEYWPVDKVERALASGKLFRGVFRATMYEPLESGVVVIRSPAGNAEPQKTQVAAQVQPALRIRVQGAAAVNRSVDGDLVAVLPLDGVVDGAAGAGRNAIPTIDADAFSSVTEQVVTAASALGSESSDPLASTSSQGPRLGKIVAVLERRWRAQYCGSLQAKYTADTLSFQGRRRHLFLPVDRRIPPILLETLQAASLYGKRVAVALDRWDTQSRFPVGHVVSVLGRIGDEQVETQVLLLENGIVTRPFSEAALACLPPPDFSVAHAPMDTTLVGRLDLRSMFVFSIDPPGCTDIDDALHCRLVDRSNGQGANARASTRLQVGVHIADVASFVRAGTALDEEARERGCTVYLVDQRIEMLPALLTSNLCSLVAGKDRYAFSVLFELDVESAQINDVQFTRSMIRSRASLTYEQAQLMLDALVVDKQSAKQLGIPPELGEALPLLARVAGRLRAERLANGALILASPEIRFERADGESPSPSVGSGSRCRSFDTHHLVEEFMLLANVTVAKRIVHQFPHSACLRRHPPPSVEQFEPLVRAAAAYGIEMHVDSSKALAASLDAVSTTSAGQEDPLLEELFRMLATRCMMQAAYCSAGSAPASSYYHYGLAVPLYTHFTSPIRRYADIIVHRQLAASLGYEDAPGELLMNEQVERICEHVNERYRNAQAAGRASSALHVLLWFHRQCQRPAHEARDTASMLETDGRILRFLSTGFVAYLPKFGIEGVVRVDGAETSWVLSPDSQTILHKDSGVTYRILGACRIRIVIDENAVGADRIRFELLPRNTNNAVQSRTTSGVCSSGGNRAQDETSPTDVQTPPK